MAIHTMTIRTILLSFMIDKDTDLQNGYNTMLDKEGNYKSYTEVINQTYKELFKDMQLSVKLDDIFMKNFCMNFYNAEIGQETLAQFKVALENCLNSDCYNYLKFYDKIRNSSLEDLLFTHDMKTESESNGENKGLGIVATTPEEKLDIIYYLDDKDNKKTITVADALNENYGKSKAEGTSHTKGYSGRPLFDTLNEFARIPSIQTAIFNIIDEKIFMGVF